MENDTGATPDVNGDAAVAHGNTRTLSGIVRQIPRKLYKLLKSLFGLIILLILYSILGAALFQAIESPHEQETKTDVISLREQLLERIQNSSSTHAHVDTEKWKNVTREHILWFEEQTYGTPVTADSEDEEEVWSFWGALIFCGTIYTTIGYGHIVPATDLGKGMTILYAVFGIPLAVMVLAHLGKRFTVALKYMWASCRYHYNKSKLSWLQKRRKKTYDVTAEEGQADSDASHSDDNGSKKKVVHGYEIDDEFNLPITATLAILFVYIFFGAVMYTIWEGEWSFLDSFYFVFISISTIGFGDVLPAHQKYFLLSSVYVFIGLSLVSMCFNVVLEFLSTTMVKAKEKAAQAKEKMTEVGKQLDDKAREKMSEVEKQFDQAKEKMNTVGKEIDVKAKRKISEFGQNIEKAKDKMSEAGKTAKAKVSEAGKSLGHKKNGKNGSDSPISINKTTLK